MPPLGRFKLSKYVSRASFELVLVPEAEDEPLTLASRVIAGGVNAPGINSLTMRDRRSLTS